MSLLPSLPSSLWIPLPFCLAGALSSGCHHDVAIEESASATDDANWFGTASSTLTGGVDPTDGGVDPTDGSLYPPDFCKLHPTEDFPGHVYVCSGVVHGGVNFDYFGDADLPLNKYILCIDMTAPPYNVDKPEGYVYSCFVEISDYPFGPDLPQPNGHQVDACCLPDSPEAAPEEYCRLDGAEEFCVGASDGLNALRAELPHVPALAELHQQLENLNKYLAQSTTQTSCSTSLAEGLLNEGDFKGDSAKVTWHVEHPQELDPSVGWPWLRELRMNLYGFQIDHVEDSGLACNQLDDDALIDGLVQNGELTVTGDMGASRARLEGQFALRGADCNLASCAFRLDTLQLKVNDFSVGPLAFSDVSMSLAMPTTGTRQRGALVVAENELRLTATFRLVADGRPMFEGTPVSVGVRNHQAARFQLRGDSSLAIAELNVVRWPFNIALVSQVSP